MYKFMFITGILILTACNADVGETNQPADPNVSTKVQKINNSNDALSTGSLQEISIKGAVRCNGRIDIPPTDVISIHSRTAGYVKNVRFIQGDHVDKGTLLASLENPEFIKMQQALVETKLDLDLAQKQYKRQTTLDEGDATTSKALEQAHNNLNRLQARYDGMRSHLAALGFDVESILQDGTYQATLNIYSPTTGIVESVDANIGMLVHPEDRIMRIINYHHIHLELQVFSRNAHLVKTGQKAEFAVPGINASYEAEVVKISPAINPESGTFIAHCHIEDAASLDVIKPGQFVNATIFTADNTALGLPKDAVVRKDGRYYAYVVNGDELEMVELENVREQAEHFTFTVPDKFIKSEWVIGGAYYVE